MVRTTDCLTVLIVRVIPDTDLARYPANYFAGYLAFNKTSEKKFVYSVCIICSTVYPDIRPDIRTAGYQANETGYPAN